MLRSLSRGTILVALTLMWLAGVWLVLDLLFADPAMLVFGDLALFCAVLAPIIYLVGWTLRWLGLRLGNDGALRRV